MVDLYPVLEWCTFEQYSCLLFKWLQNATKQILSGNGHNNDYSTDSQWSVNDNDNDSTVGIPIMDFGPVFG